MNTKFNPCTEMWREHAERISYETYIKYCERYHIQCLIDKYENYKNIYEYEKYCQDRIPDGMIFKSVPYFKDRYMKKHCMQKL